MTWLSVSFLLCGIGTATCAQEPYVKETPQQTNERIHELGAASTKPAVHDYLIGSGDMISVNVFDVPELSRDLRVSQAGEISMPLVPVRMHVAGLTELQCEQKIAEVLEANGLVSNAQVGVMVKEHRSRPITIVGAVMHPMVYEADRNVTLLELLAEAGGIANDAGDTVIVTRQPAATFVQIPNPDPIPEKGAPGAGEPPALDPETGSGATSAPAASKDANVFPSASDMAAAKPATTAVPTVPVDSPPPPNGNALTINLNELLETGDMRNNVVLQAGDIVTVPHAGIIYVLGAVNKPGGFVVSNDRSQFTTMKVLALAGGLTNVAKTDHALIIHQSAQGKQSQSEIDLKKVLKQQVEDPTMHASDILYVPEDRTKQVILKAVELGIIIGTGVAVYRLAYH